MTVTPLSRQGGRRYRTMSGCNGWLLSFLSSVGSAAVGAGKPYLYYAMQRVMGSR